MMSTRKKNKVAFTLTELAVALIILVLVFIIVSKEAVSQTKRKADIEKIQSTYKLLEKASIAWQSENDCYEDIKICVLDSKNMGIPNKKIFNGIAKYLPVVAASTDLNAKGLEVKGENISKIEWLPYETKTLDGEHQNNSSIGVSKYFDGNSNKNISYYLLRNGVTISANFSEFGSNTGYGFFDINGKDGENRIGVDVFPFSIGADISPSNPLYEVAAKKFNPYFSSNFYRNFDICNININNCNNDKLATNPTVYVLKWNKLP